MIVRTDLSDFRNNYLLTTKTTTKKQAFRKRSKVSLNCGIKEIKLHLNNPCGFHAINDYDQILETHRVHCDVTLRDEIM